MRRGRGCVSRSLSTRRSPGMRSDATSFSIIYREHSTERSLDLVCKVRASKVPPSCLAYPSSQNTEQMQLWLHGLQAFIELRRDAHLPLRAGKVSALPPSTLRSSNSLRMDSPFSSQRPLATRQVARSCRGLENFCSGAVMARSRRTARWVATQLHCLGRRPWWRCLCSRE